MHMIVHLFKILPFCEFTMLLKNFLAIFYFSEVAPGGAIMSKAFVELLADTAALTYGLDTLPDMWLSISYSQVKKIAQKIRTRLIYPRLFLAGACSIG